MSAEKLYGSPNKTSGAIYIGDPTIVYVKSKGSIFLQKPKSAIFTILSCNKILDGFRSLCNIFSFYNDSKPFKS